MQSILERPMSISESCTGQSKLRAAITAHTRAPEAACVARLITQATLPADMAHAVGVAARTLVEALRAKGSRGMVAGLVREYDLSSQEGVALMCLAEALLRIPDRATRDALIRDKIGGGDWRAHAGHSPSLFVNAATWGLVVTGKLAAAEAGLNRLLARSGGEALVRRGVDQAMRMMGEQFVAGQTIAEALAHGRPLEARGFRHSYDMLGEAAATAADAERYHRDYEQAIHAIGRAAASRGPHDGPGISVKLSALHPRYARAQRARVTAELLPRLVELARLARGYDISLNIDAEEADRLEPSLDLLEALCHDPALAGWDGVGFVVQAYQKRAPFVLDWVIDLARRTGHRLMVRLVKGAYWDSEIKRAQVDGLDGFPVFTRKLHTDVSYLACARTLLAAGDAVFPQFATHNAYTVAAIHGMAGTEFHAGQYEFQCLHGMGEPLCDEVIGALGRPCRIYAPVGSHETLLAYLVRRLLENGANSSFVNRVQDPAVSVDELVTDPVALAAGHQPAGAPHPGIALPRDLFGTVRANSAGLDLANEQVLAALDAALVAPQSWRAAPHGGDGPARPVRNPADQRDIVGEVVEADAATVERALVRAAAASWPSTPPAERAACLLRAADLLEQRMQPLLGLIVREAGRSLPNAVAEVREAVDFLRYYGAAVRDGFDASHVPLGPVACISPWNFPLAIFTGQVAAALAAGNPVLAKPAEQTPLIAAQAVALLHEAGIPHDALQLLPGDGAVGAALAADPRVRGVAFTGSMAAARAIRRQLAQRLNPDGCPVPLIAETGGQNAMVADSSALAEQVVADVLASAFDSAGQRCSALRVLCLQEECADRVLAMLRGALAELSVGDPALLATDIGPVISAAARDDITAHIGAMREAGNAVHQGDVPPGHGFFVAPAIVEIDQISVLTREVFGPVLHVLRYRRDGLERLLAEIDATGYGLTFGLHSRIDATIARVTALSRAGNIYVNRNLVGAVVGVQPFGGHGLSGTGPKAGGPLYLRRLLAAAPPWSPGAECDLPGPVGERNLYGTQPCGTVLCLAEDGAELRRQVTAALAAGNRVLVAAGALQGLAGLPPERVAEAFDLNTAQVDAVLFSGSEAGLQALDHLLADWDGPIVQVTVAAPGGTYPLERLVREQSISINTAAAGGNASLMALA